MAATYFYVSTGGGVTGTRTTGGGVGTARTGAFSAMAAGDVYASVQAALSDSAPPVAGDFILCSSDHDFTDAGTIEWNQITQAYPAGVYSVNDSACDQFLAGAQEEAGGLGDINLAATGASLYVNGLLITIGDDLNVAGANTHVIFENCTITFTGNGDKINLGSVDGPQIILINTDVVWAAGTTQQAITGGTGGGAIEMYGGSFMATTSTLQTLIFGGSGGGGMRAKFSGVDLSEIANYMLEDAGGTYTSDDAIDFSIINCKMPTSYTGDVEEAFTSPSHYYERINSGATSAEAEYQYYVKTWTGEVEDVDDAGIHRDESLAFPSGTKVSWKATTNANASLMTPFVFNGLTTNAALSASATDTIRIYFAVLTATTLHPANCWAEIYYPDGTDKHVYNLKSNRNADVLATPSAHTDDSGGSTWKDGASALTGYNEYYMDLDTSGDVGADCVPEIRIYIGEPSIVVYFDTTVDLV